MSEAVISNPVRLERGDISKALESGSVAIISSWTATAQMSRSLSAYLEALEDIGFTSLVVNTSDVEGALEWPYGIPDSTVVLRRCNVGYDFGSWGAVLSQFQEIRSLPRVLITNDSMVGPFEPLTAIDNAISDSSADVFALTESYQIEHHFQSFFVLFRNGVLAEEPWVRFFESVRQERSKENIIQVYEFGLMRTCELYGYSWDVMLDAQTTALSEGNPTFDGWKVLLDAGIPMVKRSLVVSDRYVVMAANAIREVRQRYGEGIDDWLPDGVSAFRIKGDAARFEAGKRSLVRRVGHLGVKAIHKLKSETSGVLRAQGLRVPGPASHGAWLARSSGHPNAWVPPGWRSASKRVGHSGARVAVLLHLESAEGAHAIIQSELAKIPVPFDLFITRAPGTELAVGSFRVGEVRRVIPLDVQSRGGSLAAVVWLANAGYLDSYDLVLKLRSDLSPDSLRACLGDLIGSADNVRAVLALFASDPSLGCLGQEGSLRGPESWGSGRVAARELLKRLGIADDHLELSFSAGGMYWIRSFILQGLRALAMTPEDFEKGKGDTEGTTAYALERTIGVLTSEAGYRTSSTGQELQIQGPGNDGWRRFIPGTPVIPSARVIPFYAPQFHTAAAGEEEWSQGEREWNRVMKARQSFSGHVQPLIPSELGTYDLRNDEVRRRQLDLEEYAGVRGLMYYYYWFSGARSLNLPIERLLEDKNLDQPFCLMWMNEDWIKPWDGVSEEILRAQRYDELDTGAFIDDVMPFLEDRRYLRMDGKPVLSVFRPADIPDVGEVTREWRARAAKRGVGEIYLLAVDTDKKRGQVSHQYRESGFDGIMGYPPLDLKESMASRAHLNVKTVFHGRLLSYKDSVHNGTVSARKRGVESFPTVMVSFDNTSRKKLLADIWYGSNPYTFRRWLDQAVSIVASRPLDQRLVFVNAWNDWTDSAVLEPTLRWGPTYIQAVRSVVYE
ncbi:glycoside hydrolase family 99-like domain-containing protein [Actinomycetaceae bacterium MB13-C1-2]|nr:glycoside hydrolase family 99-like domain-containing protein [Actinomycetaceae bacterium MB13-C1-2]